MKYLILFLISIQSFAGIFDRDIPERSKEFKELFGEFKCHENGSNIEICENKFHFCYKYNAIKEGGIFCFSKKEMNRLKDN